MRQIDALSARDKSKRSVNVGMLLALFMTGAGVGAAAYRFATNSSDSPHLSASEDNVPNLIREGQRILIPVESPLRAKLTVAAIGEKEIARDLVLPAVVEVDPSRLVKILPPLAGRITQLKVQLGEQVGLGQPLAILDSPDLATAYADYDRATVLLGLATKNRDRLRELVKGGGISVREQQQSETDYVTADVERQRAESRLKQIGVDPETKNKSRTVTISTPISGSVIDLGVAPGAYWNDALAALMTVADLSSVWITANVPEKDTSLIAKGQPVDVVLPAYPGEVFKGHVLFVSNVLDADTRRTKVRIEFQNPGTRFKPGMFATATFFAPKQLVITVPTTALMLKNDANYVYVEVAPWSFEARPVEISFQQGEEAVIQSGLKSGDHIVVKGGVLLND